MSVNAVSFSQTIFTGNGKKGTITPDEYGYYTVVVGALNCDNSAGEHYTAEGVLELLNDSSVFKRRVISGALYSEVGHPKPTPGMLHKDFYRRVMTVEETNVCAHFSDIWLDENFGKNNPQYGNPAIIAIMAKVKPAGPKAEAVRLALENPKQNCAFSVRGLTDNSVVGGRVIRRLLTIVTFDFVCEPGIMIADKKCSPALEHLLAMEGRNVDLNEYRVHVDALSEVLTKDIETVAMESDRERFAQVLATLKPKPQTSKLRNW